MGELAETDVRFAAHNGLKSDIAPCPFCAANSGSGVFLFKDLVRAGEKGWRDVETKRLRRLEIDGKQEFGGLLDRKVGRFGALENSIDKMGAAPEQGEEVRAVRDQSTCLHNVSD